MADSYVQPNSAREGKISCLAPAARQHFLHFWEVSFVTPSLASPFLVYHVSRRHPRRQLSASFSPGNTSVFKSALPNPWWPPGKHRTALACTSTYCTQTVQPWQSSASSGTRCVSDERRALTPSSTPGHFDRFLAASDTHQSTHFLGTLHQLLSVPPPQPIIRWHIGGL